MSTDEVFEGHKDYGARFDIIKKAWLLAKPIAIPNIEFWSLHKIRNTLARDDLSIVERLDYFTSFQFINIIRQLGDIVNYGSANEIRDLLSELMPGKRNIESKLVSTTRI